MKHNATLFDKIHDILFVIVTVCLAVLTIRFVILPPKPASISYVYDDSGLQQRVSTLEETVGLKGELAQPTGLQQGRKKQ